MLTNKEIVDGHLDLIRRCVDCQFAQVKDDFTRQFKDDLFQDLIVTLYEYDNSKLNDAYGKGEGTLNALITAIIRKSVWSSTSPFYRNYKRLIGHSDEITETLIESYAENDDEYRYIGGTDIRRGLYADSDD